MSHPLSARAKIYRISLDAVLLAVNVILNCFVPSEISWASLPVLLCAFLFRPADAVLVATLGSLIEQVMYGLGPQTLVWMLPWVIFSLFVGFGAVLVRRTGDKLLPTVLVIVVGELLLNACNTTALLYFGYIFVDPSAYPTLPMALILPLFYLGRMPQAVVRAVLSSVVIPLLLPPLRRILSKFFR